MDVKSRWLYAGGMLALLFASIVGILTGGIQPEVSAQNSTATVELETDDDAEETTDDTAVTAEATGAAGTEADRSLVAAIYAGTCAEFSDAPLFDIGDLPAAEQLAADEETEFVGSTEAAPAFRVEVVLGSAIETLFTDDEPYVLVVRDPEQDKRHLACGELGGYPVEGQIVVGLRADDGDDRDDSEDRDEFCGIAVFGASEDHGDDPAEDQTPLRIYLFATAEDDGDDDGNQNVDATADVTAESTAESDDDSGGDDDNSGSGGDDDDSGGDDDNSGSGGGDDSDDDDD